MDFMKLLKSFEEFLFEAATWLIFYPLTLWHILRQPLTTMEYSDREQSDDAEHSYDDALSPPLLLLVTIVLANLISAAAHIPPPNASSALLASIASTQQNLILFRSMIFSLVPLVAAATLVRRQGKKLSRQALRAPFYAQCYLAALCATFVSLGDTFLQRADLSNAIGYTIIGTGTIWFLAVQTAWFTKKLNISRGKAALIALWATVRAFIYLLIVIVPIVLI